MERNKDMRMNKMLPLILAVTMAGSVLLSSCSNETVETVESSTEATTTVQSETTAAETSEETVTETSASIPVEKIELDGNRKSKFTTTGFSYIESENLVIFMDKDVTLPGDFVVNTEAILKELESQLGISHISPRYNNPYVMDHSIYYEPLAGTDEHPNPWAGREVGDKVQIFIVIDRKPEGLISGATDYGITLCEYELFSDEIWNSIPEFRDSPWRRNDYIDYSVIAHELTHTLTERNCDLSLIMTEGIAQYMGYSAINKLASDYPSLATVKKKKDFSDGSMPFKVNGKNAEQIFLDDFSTLDHAERGAEYYYGRRLWEYLYKQHGSDAFKIFCDKLNTEGIEYQYNQYNESTMKEYERIVKELFGDDVFSDFGKWCVKKGYLQTVSVQDG